MSNTHKLDAIFNPHRIALIGVTTNPRSVGGKVLTNLVGSGFRGVVYPVNPQHEAVLGIPCFRDIASLPNTPDLGVICTAAEEVPAYVRQCGEAGVKGIIIMSAGFKETGEEGAKLEAELKAEAAKFSGMRILGPNCLGVIIPGLNLNVSFATGMPKKGNIAFISQSGALCSSVLDWALEEKIGFSYFVSVGNATDVGFGDLIDYFGEDEKTKAIILYIESIGEARHFMTAARAFARTKPIIAYKAGRFPESAEVAASHTGAMAAEDAVYNAAFERIGMARVLDIGEIFDCAELLGRQKLPKGPRLGIVTNAGGPGVMATDALIAADGTLAKLADDTMEKLNENLPSFWSHGNPVDVLGDARSKRFAKATRIVVEDPGVDAVLVILTPQAMTNPTATAKTISQLAETTPKPILAAWLGGQSLHEGIRILNDNGISTYSTPERAIRAFMTLVSYSRNLESLYETPKDVPVEFTLDRKQLRDTFDGLLAGHETVLPEESSKKILEAYGIPTTYPHPAKSADEAVALADKIGYPVVLKILSKDITHKTDVGGVALDIDSPRMAREKFEQVVQSARKARPGAAIDGVTVQLMVNLKKGRELILGIKKDPVFGTVIMVGFGGTAAELFADRALGFPPLNEKLALRMLKSLKIWPLLNGYRGRPPVNIDTLIGAMIRLSYLAADYPEISELDINPLLASEDGVMALDARVVIDREFVGDRLKPYKHLALKPYPEEYVRNVELKDGTKLCLRPIKPEDEPMWMELLASCSRESIYARFRYFFQWESHEVATHYCFIDYDREIAIVAEIEEKGERKLLGVGRLVADPDHETGEYAVLIADAWQEKGLGTILTDYCLEIAHKWGLKSIVAETTATNERMLSVFKKRGFTIKPDAGSSLVEVHKELTEKNNGTED